MPTMNIRGFIWVRLPNSDGSLGTTKLVPMRHHEHGPGASYPNGGGYKSKEEMIQSIKERTRNSYPLARIEEIPDGLKIDYHYLNPAVGIQEITWTD